MSTQHTENTVDYQILRISTGDGEQHQVLVEIRQKTNRFHEVSSEHQISTIMVKATYITGPMSSRHAPIGYLSKMEGNADTFNNLVKLTNGEVILREPFRGLGIGSFMFDIIVRWAKKLDPSTKVAPIKVGAVDATEENRERRNKFYANFGISFGVPLNKGIIDGRSMPMTVDDLISHEAWSTKMERLDILSALRTYVDDFQRVLKVTTCNVIHIDNLKAEISHLRQKNSKKTWGIIALITALMLAAWLSWF